MKEEELKIKVPIPDGMVLKSARSEIKDGVVVVIPEYEEKPEYKDGDILALLNGTIFIYNSDNSKIANSSGNNYYVAISIDSSLYLKASFNTCTYLGHNNQIRSLATEEEKQKLFDILTKNGYKWNAEEKKIEKVLPRALRGEKYFFLSSILQTRCDDDFRLIADTERYKSGNYFLTKEEAEKYAAKFKEMLKNRIL